MEGKSLGEGCVSREKARKDDDDDDDDFKGGVMIVFESKPRRRISRAVRDR